MRRRTMGVAIAAVALLSAVAGAQTQTGIEDPPATSDIEAPQEPPVNGKVEHGRDPFRPFILDLVPETVNMPLTPLQQYELGQLKVSGVVWALNPPRAMLQDNNGMGYIVVPGTPIGRHGGVVRSIEPSRVIVEEKTFDYYGREQVRQIVMELPREDQPQDTTARE